MMFKQFLREISYFFFFLTNVIYKKECDKVIAGSVKVKKSPITYIALMMIGVVTLVTTLPKPVQAEGTEDPVLATQNIVIDKQTKEIARLNHIIERMREADKMRDSTINDREEEVNALRELGYQMVEAHEKEVDKYKLLLKAKDDRIAELEKELEDEKKKSEPKPKYNTKYKVDKSVILSSSNIFDSVMEIY